MYGDFRGRRGRLSSSGASSTLARLEKSASWDGSQARNGARLCSRADHWPAARLDPLQLFLNCQDQPSTAFKAQAQT